MTALYFWLALVGVSLIGLMIMLRNAPLVGSDHEEPRS